MYNQILRDDLKELMANQGLIRQLIFSSSSSPPPAPLSAGPLYLPGCRKENLDLHQQLQGSRVFLSPCYCGYTANTATSPWDLSWRPVEWHTPDHICKDLWKTIKKNAEYITTFIVTGLFLTESRRILGICPEVLIVDPKQAGTILGPNS